MRLSLRWEFAAGAGFQTGRTLRSTSALLLVISPHQSIYFPRLRDMMTRITSDVPAKMV
jgi:hypothetical protein